MIWLWNDYGLIVVVLGVAVWLWVSGYWRDVWDWLRPLLHKAWGWTKRIASSAWQWLKDAPKRLWRWLRGIPKRLWHWLDRRVRTVWGWSLKRLHIREHQGPGWLSYEIHGPMKQASEKHQAPRATRSRLAVPSRATIRSLVGLLVGLVGLSIALALIPLHMPGVAATSDRFTVFNTMWQVQAGIAALALPVLTFGIERASNDKQIFARSAEVMGRESWSFLVIGFSFVVVARMGIDLAFFPTKSLVFVTDVALFLVTIAAAVFAYYRVLRLTLSPAMLSRRSMALLRERIRKVLLESIRQRLGNNILFGRLAPLGVTYWPLGGRSNTQYLVLEAQREGMVLDIQLDKLEQFIESLPRRATTPTTGQPGQPQTTAPLATNPPVSILIRFESRLSREQRGLLRLDRSAFTTELETRRRDLEDSLNRIVRIGEADEF
jgi:hypothetical protein